MITMDDITGSAYERFIDYALAHTDAFMFVGCNYYNSRIYKTHVKPFIKELQPYAIKRRHDPQWPGTVQAGTDRYQRTIYFYRSDPNAAAVLKSAGRIFGWVYPYYPEDLAFFRQGYCWMASVAHEEYLWFYRETKEDLTFFRSLGVLEMPKSIRIRKTVIMKAD